MAQAVEHKKYLLGTYFWINPGGGRKTCVLVTSSTEKLLKNIYEELKDDYAINYGQFSTVFVITTTGEFVADFDLIPYIKVKYKNKYLNVDNTGVVNTSESEELCEMLDNGMSFEDIAAEGDTPQAVLLTSDKKEGVPAELKKFLSQYTDLDTTLEQTTFHIHNISSTENHDTDADVTVGEEIDLE